MTSFIIFSTPTKHSKNLVASLRSLIQTGQDGANQRPKPTGCSDLAEPSRKGIVDIVDADKIVHVCACAAIAYTGPAWNLL